MEIGMETIICVDRVTRIYTSKTMKTIANDNISFEIKQGDFVWIHGRSGSGKTTLMNMITGLATPTSGKIQFLHNTYTHMSDKKKALLRRNCMGLMFQHFELLPMFNGYENIALPMINRT